MDAPRVEPLRTKGSFAKRIKDYRKIGRGLKAKCARRWHEPGRHYPEVKARKTERKLVSKRSQGCFCLIRGDDKQRNRL